MKIRKYRRLIVIALAALNLACSSLSEADSSRVLARIGDVVTLNDNRSAIIESFGNFPGNITPLMDLEDNVSLMMAVRGPEINSINKLGIWRWPAAGGIEHIIQIGQPLPALGLGITWGISDINALARSAGYGLVMKSRLGGALTSVNDSAIHYWTPTHGMRLVARSGDQVPGAAPGVTYSPSIFADTEISAFDSGLSFYPARQSARESLFFFSRLAGNVTTNDDAAVFQFLDGRTNIVIREGDVAPGHPELRIAEPRISPSPSGSALVYTWLNGPGVVTTGTPGGALPNRQLILKPTQSQGGAITAIARQGEQAFGVHDRYYSELFKYIFDTGSGLRTSVRIVPQVNSVEDVAFSAVLVNADGTPAGSGVFAIIDGQPQRIAISGDDAPGYPPGANGERVKFSSLFQPSSIDPMHISEPRPGDGEIAVTFLAGIEGPNVNSLTNRALYRYTPNRGVHLLMKGGAPIPGLAANEVISNSSLSRKLVNKYGDLLLTATITDAHNSQLPNSTCLVRVSDSGPQLILREGDSIASGFTASLEYSKALFNALGQGVIQLSVRHPNESTPRDAVVRFDRAGRIKPWLILGTLQSDIQGPRVVPISWSSPYREAFSDNGTWVGSISASGGGEITGALLMSFKINESCPADFNSDGSATVQDIFDFLSLWFAQDTAADFNNDQAVTVQDLFDFLDVWFGGCS